MTPWCQRPRGEEVSVIEFLYGGPVSTVTLRTFAVWAAMRTWHLVAASADYDLDTRARLRFARALNTARREAHGRVTVVELRAAWMDARDERAMKTSWWPERLANRGAFSSAAQMAARFACRATCHPDATIAALTTSHSTGWAIGYLAASHAATHELTLAAMESHNSSSHVRWLRILRVAHRFAEEARRAEEAEHVRELRRWIG